MCADCQRRYDENPLRILDCKEDRCQPFIEQAPGSADHLCEACAEHFTEVRGWLDRLGLAYEIDPRLVRGLDYYTRTVFELMSKDLGSQDTLLGGGRYDGLMEMLGGPATPGIGFAGGYERLVLVLQENAKRKNAATEEIEPCRLDLYVAMLGEEGRRFGVELAQGLRRGGIAVDYDHRGRALRKQMTQANRLNAQHVLVIGEDEASSRIGKLKEMDSGSEREVELTIESLTSQLGTGCNCGCKHGA
jgi:histidyl-tRNA synthetase